MQEIKKESLYGLWITFAVEFDGKLQPTEHRYYKYHFNRNGFFEHATYEGFTVIQDRRKKKWELVKEDDDQKEEYIIHLNKERCYKIMLLEESKLVLQVLKNGLIYHLACADQYTSVVREMNKVKTPRKGNSAIK